ncbi:hypothetical protein FHW64_005243 [Variovorax sp. Sphag1AA]|nr:hypothetical protein [Variovorax sp. Sphag1AA]
MRDWRNTEYLASQSVRLLAVGEHGVKDRLLRAYTERLQFVFPDDVPVELKPLVVSIRKRLFREPRFKGQSTVESALYRMHGKTASAIAEDIYELALALSSRERQ